MFSYAAYQRNLRKALAGRKMPNGATTCVAGGEFVIHDHYGKVIGRLNEGEFERIGT